MRHLAVDGLHYRMRFAADGYRAPRVRIRKRLQCLEQTRPAVLPEFQQRLARGWWIYKFAISIAVRLLADRGQEIGPAGPHVAGHVLHDDRDRVRFFIQQGEELFVRDLLHRAFGKLLVIPEQRQGVLDVRRGELQCHASSLKWRGHSVCRAETRVGALSVSIRTRHAWAMLQESLKTPPAGEGRMNMAGRARSAELSLGAADRVSAPRCVWGLYSELLW